MLMPNCTVMKAKLALLCFFVFGAAIARATSNYDYGADEYVTIAKGISPNGQYAVTAHGGGEGGYDNFHIFLTNAVTGRKIGPLEEIVDTLDTGADSFCAKWSGDSQQVVIFYRISRHEPLRAVSYHIAKARAFLIKGPANATEQQTSYWGSQCSQSQPSERIFGTPKVH